MTKLEAYQTAYDTDEAEAERLIQEYYNTDMQAFFDCMQWYVNLVPPPSERAGAELPPPRPAKPCK